MAENDELGELVRMLHHIQERIQELTGGTVDAVLHPSGETYLLRRAQEELRRREADQRGFAELRAAILDALPANIALLDVDGTIIAVNRSWRQFASANVYPEGELGIGLNYLEVCENAQGEFAEEAANAADGVRAVLHGERQHYNLVYPCHSPDRQRWFRMTVTPVKTHQITGAVVAHNDITEHRQLEEQLRQSHRLEAVGQLTGGVAHDFNNLLTVIHGNAEQLNEALQTDDRLNPLASMIISASERAAALTHYLLAFARKQPLAPRRVDVNQLVTGMEGLIRRSIGEHIEVQFSTTDALWPTLIDAAQLESALLNLAINARDAMPQGGELTIATANREFDGEHGNWRVDVSPGQYIEISISDTGTGIKPEHLERIFEPFFTTKAPGEGTGLGLSMVYGFVKQSEGHIAVESDPTGTTLRLYLPRLIRDSADVPREATASDSAGGGETILMVEDDELVRGFVEGQLNALGYRVLKAVNGAMALELLREHPEVDLLFTDIVMPGGMNGRALADAAVQLKPGLKVLFTSGYPDSAIGDQGQIPPDVQLLTKPYRRRELARQIRVALQSG